MKLWISKNAEIPLREQLTRQIILAIISGDLPKNAKLPSVREIAIRHKIHQNTVSTAYKWLEENDWVDLRKGSGVYVREVTEKTRLKTKNESDNELENLVANFFRTTKQRGFSQESIQQTFEKFLTKNTPEKIVLIENDRELRRILAAELEKDFDCPVISGSLNDSYDFAGAIAVAMTETFEEVREILRAESLRLPLKFNSVQDEMRGQTKPANDQIIGIASHWEKFLRWTQTILIAAGIEGESILVRDAGEENWQKGLSQCTFVISDSVTARLLPKSIDVRIFRLISENSIDELRTHFD